MMAVEIEVRGGLALRRDGLPLPASCKARALLLLGVPGAECVRVPTDSYFLLGREPAATQSVERVRAFPA